ncbi:MAG: ABC transporter ATP-binding protein [Hyphomicrobiales bacterium]
MSFVEIRNLSKRFGDTPVFEGIDLDIEQGTICVLVGPSGCGKTTLLRAVAGLTKQDRGTIAIDDKDVSAVEPKHRGIGMVFQHYALFPNMTVEQNLAFGLEQQKLDTATIGKKVSAMIALMGLEARAKARPHALSGGQKQRVALARALVLEPKLLLLDEPLSALDAQIRKRLREELKRLQREVGFTAMFVTHDQEEALLLGDRVAVMQAGRFSQVGTPAQIYNRPASLSVARFIGDFNILEPDAVARAFRQRPEAAWAIHPQVIGLANGKAIPGSHRAEARITGIHILGAIIRYTADVNGVAIKLDTLNRPNIAMHDIGATIPIEIAANDICSLKE